MQDSKQSRTSLQLPDAPVNLAGEVKAWSQPVEFLTYTPQPADKNPMFLEKRVYQGSSGRVYPLPFIDRIAIEPVLQQWEAIHIENEYLRLMILPEIGGRIHLGLDKITGYDFFYRQNVIKPALVGLAGPWASGGVEFNWPQHHRPATFMRVQTEIEHHPDGSVTVWCSDHDPMQRMKGMHGICLRPGHATVELKVRLYNRTPLTQTFLWWANVAVHVHERYQSFFPPDSTYVADHAKRAITTYPRSEEPYYGIDYPGRAREGVPADELPAAYLPDGSYPADDLSWYANIPVPTSYMVIGTEGNFSGGYDHRADAGVVHVANHHISPGKKQWTWGNQEFGYSWDRSLTDYDGPYIEIMAGVYTDNQPDFSWLGPWETKTFVQHWFPISRIGVPQVSNVRAALSLRVNDRSASIGLYVTQSVGPVTITLRSEKRVVNQWQEMARVGSPVVVVKKLPDDADEDKISVTVESQGCILIAYDRAAKIASKKTEPASEPPQPSAITSIEELYLTGLHLHQYRHATRLPEMYWMEALRRSPEDSRVNHALGLWRLRRGEFEEACVLFERAITTITRFNPNPADGEAFYSLGLAERFLNHEKQAYAAFYKATWNAAWRGPARLALAEIDAAREDWTSALDHVERSLLVEGDNLVGRNLLVLVLDKLGQQDRAAQVHEATRTLDPLDLGSRWRDGIAPSTGQERLDLALDLLRWGQQAEAARVLASGPSDEPSGSLPIELLLLARLQRDMGEEHAEATLKKALDAPLDYCFPFRLEEALLLKGWTETCPADASPHYLYGNFLYDRRRHDEGIAEWELAAKINPAFATVWRNLGIGLFNIRADAKGARAAFDRALVLNPGDARVFYERDQLWKRTGELPELRLEEMERHLDLVVMRDDLSIELATLYNQLGRQAEALELLLNRHFQPWEGGEGMVLHQYKRALLLLGQDALRRRDPDAALAYFESIDHPPQNLSEARHLLSNSSDVFYWHGVACSEQGDEAKAATWWVRAAEARGDFQQMAVRNISEMTFWSALSLKRLGQADDARALFQKIYDYSIELEATVPEIDYFATSLPTMLIFEDDLVRRNRVESLFLRAQALCGLDRREEAVTLLQEISLLDRNHTGGADLAVLVDEFSEGSRSSHGPDRMKLAKATGEAG